MPFTCTISADLFRRAAICSSTEATRWYLNGVQVEPHPDGVGVLLIATDGHRMVCIHDREGSANENAIVSTDPALLKAATAKVAEKITIADNRAKVTGAGDVLQFQGVSDAVVDGSFPDWRRVVPAMSDETKLGTFNPSLLLGLSKALGDTKTNALAFRSADATGPALVFGDLPDAFGVVMPIRDVRTPAVPAWAQR